MHYRNIRERKMCLVTELIQSPPSDSNIDRAIPRLLYNMKIMKRLKISRGYND